MILLLGGSGYDGGAFCELVEQQGLPYRNLTRSGVDYTSVDTLSAAVKRVQPDYVINAAGYTGKPDVDASELNRADHLAGNAVLPDVVRNSDSQAVDCRVGQVASATTHHWNVAHLESLPKPLNPPRRLSSSQLSKH